MYLRDAANLARGRVADEVALDKRVEVADREEEEAVRQVRLYEASQREARVHRMEQEIV
jgi:hypothetical protein